LQKNRGKGKKEKKRKINGLTNEIGANAQKGKVMV